jgi:hypothetical protein
VLLNATNYRSSIRPNMCQSNYSLVVSISLEFLAFGETSELNDGLSG